MDIAIRAEGGKDIGMGHIMRTLVLADELRISNNVFYIFKIKKQNLGYDAAIKKIKSEGFEVKAIPENGFHTQLERIKADLLITDSYDVDDEYFNITKKLYKKTMYIDDTGLYYYNVDFLLNQNINAADLCYKVGANTKLFLGSKYSLLRREFRDLPKKTVKDKVKNVLLTIGGSDPFNVTGKILDWIKGLDFTFHVVIGPSFSDDFDFRSCESDKIKLYHNPNMASIMKECDIAVSACGSTLYELCAFGIPTIGIIIAENQKEIARKMEEQNIIKSLGWYYDINRDCFVRSLIKVAEDYDWRRNASKLASVIIDGKGVYRICSALNEEI